MTIDINDTNSYNSHHTSHSPKMQPKSKPDTLLLSHAMPTKQQPPARPKHADIFSPRPETPAPAQFPFLNSPTPPRHSRATPQPPTPPRPRPRRTRQTLSADDALPRRNGLDLGVRQKTSFELTLAAFPAPPTRTPFFRSLPASPMASSIRLWKDRKSPLGLGRKSEDQEDVEMDLGSDDDSDCRTITGIPATPSTVNSGWDNFWSEPPSPAEDASRCKHERLLTEAALIREAYLKLKSSGYEEREEVRYPMQGEDEGRYQ